MLKCIQIFVLILFPLFLFSQDGKKTLQGKVMGESGEHGTMALVGASVYWAGTTTGTITDEKGHFELAQQPGNQKMVVSFVGFRNDTIWVNNQPFVDVTLTESLLLGEVQVVHRQKTTAISMIDPLKIEKIGEGELLKAACCNLSESFETNPSVDVSFTDAITGTRQIMMLGLAGPYTQITRESMPDIRGLSSIYGLTYIPGPWVESIQLIKGTGTVANGFESMAGQINVELRKPEQADKVYLNLFGSKEGRLEANANFTHRLQNNWSTGLLLHGSTNNAKVDHNSDGFLDNPLGNNLIALHRWKYQNPDGMEFQAGIKGTYSEKTGGQINFDPSAGESQNENYIWGMQITTERVEGWAKTGKVLNAQGRSIGLQLSGTYHDQSSYYGLNDYDGRQQSFYANLLYQDILGNTNHQFRTGASFQYDDYNESFNDTSFDRMETVPGVFFEYTYKYLEKLSTVAGLRADYHNMYGLFFTPRLHARYAPLERTVFRISAGRGQRTNSILAENTGLMASSRTFDFSGGHANYPYGLEPEVAWTIGGSFTQAFHLDYREGYVSFDFFRTDFQNQVVVDLEDPRKVSFYNLDGASYSNSFQAQVDYEIIPRLDGRLAYRWYDVKTTYDGKLLEKPLVANNRAFLNLAYHTRDFWKFDFTLNWQGEKRIPPTFQNPMEYRLESYSPSFFTMNAQVSKTWWDKFEVYAGAENLLNFKQPNPIVASNDAFGPNFDASMIWGPVMGRNIYAGLRLRIK
jgi:outer membrane receptor for ferrienterochelin and colicins